PGITGAETQPSVNRFQSLLVATVEAQCDAQRKMAERKVCVQLDRAARIAYRSPDVASPMARLSEHAVGVRVLAIEAQSVKCGLPRLEHQRREVLDRAIVQLRDEGAGEPEMRLGEVGVECYRSLEQAVRCCSIPPAELVEMPEPALAVVPCTHM